MAASLVSAIIDPDQLSLVERLLKFRGRYLYKKPINWTNDHLGHFECKFLRSDEVDDGEPASSEESVDDVQRLATTGDPLAIQNLLNPYIDKPATERELDFLFDYDPHDARTHLQRFLLHGAYVLADVPGASVLAGVHGASVLADVPGASVLADVPGSICYLNLSEVERKRKESGGYSNVARKGHDPFVAATAIAMAQRLGMKCCRMIPSPACTCRYYRTHILVAHKQREYLTVYTTSIADALMQLFDYPFSRPTICDDDACFKVEFEYEYVDYQPYNTFPARLGGVLKNHRAAAEKNFERQRFKRQELERQELARQWLEENLRQQRKLAEEEQREEEQRKEQQRKEQQRKEQQLEELRREFEQREEQKLEELRRELEQREEQKLEELRRELEQPQSSAIDDAPAFKRQRRLKVIFGRIIKWPVRMALK
ncbi:hypothetical protein F4679DRAFT_476074 [Xylaria curta]|nr:hypothetical protein F4679DRAFT_476074 [Xylaria curta]